MQESRHISNKTMLPRAQVRVELSSSEDDDSPIFSRTISKMTPPANSHHVKPEVLCEIEGNLNELRLCDSDIDDERSFRGNLTKRSQHRDCPDGPERVSDSQATKTDNDERWIYDQGGQDYKLLRHNDESDRINSMEWPDLRVPKELFDLLYDFQRTGIEWMASLHAKRIGGILGDDMGMGKTYTSLAFLGGLMRTRTIRNALIITPVSVLRSWESEANKIIKSCASGVAILVVSSDMSKSRRIKLLQGAYER